MLISPFLKNILQLIIIFTFNIHFEHAKQLQLVQAVWRHGDRAPKTKAYKNDPYDETTWTRGWNQLTNLGVQQLKQLGEYFAKRYKGFVSNNFNNTEVLMLSTDEDRSLESGASFFNGFYPLNLTKKLELPVEWQPLPIHSVGFKIEDMLLRSSHFNCKKAFAIKEQIKDDLKTDLMNNNKYNSFFNFLSQKINDGKNLTYNEVIRLNDINREIIHNLKQPDWVFKRWEEFENKTTIEIISEFWRINRVAPFKNILFSKLRGGYLLGDWIRRAKQFALMEPLKNNVSNQKMILYSAHDNTLLSLLYVMNINKDDLIVPYASCIIMELYKDDDGEYYVEIYYRRNKTLETRIIDGCNQFCPLKKFIQLLEDVTIYTKEDLLEQSLSFCFVYYYKSFI